MRDCGGWYSDLRCVWEIWDVKRGWEKFDEVCTVWGVYYFDICPCVKYAVYRVGRVSMKIIDLKVIMPEYSLLWDACSSPSGLTEVRQTAIMRGHSKDHAHSAGLYLGQRPRASDFTVVSSAGI